MCAKLVCPVNDCQAARWHAGYAPPIQHGEWRRQTRFYSRLRFILCIAADIWQSWNKNTFHMRSLLVHIIGLTVHLLWHGPFIALLITLRKFYHTAQSEFNFLLIWELVCVQSVLEHSPPTILPGRDVLPDQSYRTPRVVMKMSMEQWWNSD